MAEKRMFTKKVTESDAFLDMPLSTQALYFHLNMNADDEGFVNNAKKIQRTIGASDDDLKLLVLKKFIIPYESGVIVIKHWKMHNYIAKDRFHKSPYDEERSLLEVKENGVYTLKGNEEKQDIQNDAYDLYTDCIQDVYADKNRLEEIRLEENSIDILGKAPAEEKSIFIKLILNDKTEYEVTYEDVNNYQELYPAVDVKQQLRNMKGWCDANPTNRKTRTGIKRFINSWLSKEQNRGGSYKPEMPQEKNKNFDANKGLIRGNYNFEELEAETKNRHTGAVKEPIKEPEKKPESKLVAKMLSLPIGKDFRFAYQGKEFWGTRYEKSVAIMVKGGDFKQIPIEKLEEHIEELPEYKK